MSHLRLALIITTAFLAHGSGSAETRLKNENFDRDPGWEAINNRIVPESRATVRQDFGYSVTDFASKAKGEIGGTVWRVPQPAWYAAKIPPKSLDDRLSASGTFAIPATGSGGVCFGWFNSNQERETSRPVQALGLQIGGAREGSLLHVRLHTAQNQSAGTLIQPPGKKARGTFRNDGTRYAWTLEYDPQANDGNGRIVFVVRGNLEKPEPFENQSFVIDLPAGYRQQGAVFDRFGLLNITKPGGQLTVYFGDLQLDGHTLALTRDPEWDAVGNRAATERGAGGANDFGFSATNHAEGGTGELGGTLWRTGKLWAYYADPVGPLTFENRLEASGRVVLEVGAPDSGLHFGWFKNCSQEKGPEQAGSFVGVRIAGPSRIGHYFAPSLTTAKATARTAPKAPVLVPSRSYEFTLSYDPAANNGLGAISVKLGGESATFELKRGDKAQGGEMDRFGLFSIHNDGGHAPVKVWFDDLKYTAH